jgi:hypothetical protein
MIHQRVLGRWRDEWMWMEVVDHVLPVEVSFSRHQPRAFCTWKEPGPAIRSSTNLDEWNEILALEVGDRVAIADGDRGWMIS